MRKHFLILMLLTLLPFTAWGAVVKVTPFNVSKYYGQADPAGLDLIYDAETPANWASELSGLTEAEKNAILRAGLQITRNGVNEGESVGDYTYTLTFKKSLATAAAGTTFSADDVTTFVTNYSVGVTGSSTLSIEKMPFVGAVATEGITVTDIPAQIYTGSAITPTLTVKNNANDEALVEGTDYTVTWENNTNTGTATVTLKAAGSKYAGQVSKTFKINAGISSATITLNGVSNLTYTGAAQAPTSFVVKVGDATLVKDTHYTVSYSNSNSGDTNPTTNAGTVTVTFTGVAAEGYSGTATATYTIAPKAVTAAQIVETLSATNPVYSGTIVYPEITSATAATLPVAAADYELTNGSTNAGAATATLTLKRNFTGSKTINYTIDQKPITLTAGTTATLDQTGATNTPNQYPWTNANIKPAVVALDGTTTIPASNYTVSYVDNGQATYTSGIGTKKATIKAKASGNYTFTDVELSYEIVKKDLTITVNDINVGYGVAFTPSLKFDGLVAEPGVAANATTEALIRAAAADNFEYYTTAATPALVPDITAAAPGAYTIKIKDDTKTTIATLGKGANYNMTFVNGTLNKTTAQVVVKIKDQIIEYGDAFPTTGWIVSHVSGLSETDAANIGNFVGITTIQNNFKLATAVDGVLDVNKEGYEVMYKDGTNADNVIVNPNYLISVQPGKLIVNKKKIIASADADNMVTIAAPGKYTGAPVSPTVTISHNLKKADGTAAAATPYLLPTDSYITDYDASYNAGVREAHVSVSADNAHYITETKVLYQATDPEVIANPALNGQVKEVLPYVIQNYTIAPLEIKITADAFTGANAWTYGTTEPAYTAKISNTALNSGDASVEADKLAALLAGEQPEGFHGKLVVKRQNADAVGTWTGALKPAIVDANGVELALTAGLANSAADNYTITVVNGDLEVKKGKITVKVKDAELIYGEAATKFYLEATSGMEHETADFENIVTYSHTPADYGYAFADFKARGNYSLNYAGAAPTATNYDIEFDTDDQGTLTVVERPIKIKVKDGLNVDYGSLATWKNTLSGNNTTKTFDSYLEVVNGETGFYGLTDGNTLKNLIASVDLKSENIGENVLSMTAATTGAALNYAITLVPGTLTINSDASVVDVVLNRVPSADFGNEHVNTAARRISENDGQFRNVKFSDFAMIAEKWYPLVLPFATSVREISAKFGYAVVNIFDGTTADGKIKFKLHMGDIDANTPFIVKVYKDMNMSDASVVFNDVKIVKAYDANYEVKVNEGSDVDFVGTYKGRTEGFRSNMYYFSTSAAYNEYYKGNDTNTTYLRPLGAYFVDNAPNAANTAREILIQEADGSTTAISSVSVDGAFVEADGWFTTNGVKLQGVPTEKGVYIRNGKKIVIK